MKKSRLRIRENTLSKVTPIAYLYVADAIGNDSTLAVGSCECLEFLRACMGIRSTMAADPHVIAADAASSDRVPTIYSRLKNRLRKSVGAWRW